MLNLLFFISSMFATDKTTICFDADNGKPLIKYTDVLEDQHLGDEIYRTEYRRYYRIIPLSSEVHNTALIFVGRKYHCFGGTVVKIGKSRQDVNYNVYAYEMFPKDELGTNTIFIPKTNN